MTGKCSQSQTVSVLQAPGHSLGSAALAAQQLASKGLSRSDDYLEAYDVRISMAKKETLKIDRLSCKTATRSKP